MLVVRPERGRDVYELTFRLLVLMTNIFVQFVITTSLVHAEIST